MKIFKILLAVLSVLVLLFSFSCGSGGKTPKVDELDMAIRDTSNYLNSVIPTGSKIAILNIQSNSPALSDYIIDELIANTVNDRIFTVVDRQQLDAIRAEQNFQYSGEVDDKSAQEIGRILGAQTIVSGAIGALGSGQRLRVRALNVETAVVQGQFNRNIAASPLIATIMQSPGAITASGTRQTVTGNTSTNAISTTNTTPAATQAPTTSAASAVQAYRIGDTGPAGGLIFFDKRNNSNGWRYLEVAPVETEFQAQWSVRGTWVENTQEIIGSGRRNTQLIVDTFNRVSGEWDTAAQKVFDLEFGGFNDWFLPSRDELDQMYGNLKRRNLGNFKEEWYWSSTQFNSFNQPSVHLQNFANGRMSSGGVREQYYVRPIRQVPGPSN